jgi:microcystin degradation protein MlrC
MAKIGVAGFLHETNTFADDVTTLSRFEQADAWPGLITGQRLFDDTHDMNLAVSGFVNAMGAPEHTLVPLLWCSANPSGPVAQDAFDTIWARLDVLLDQSGPLDALFLDLHGAMVTERYGDAEGVLLQRLRRKLGNAIPIVAALDFHANVSAAMVEHASGLLAYRSYPHVDMADTGRRAAAFLRRLLASAPPARAFRQAPYIIPMPWQSTLAEPMAGLMDETRNTSAPGVWEAVMTPGFPLADVADSGPAVTVYADTARQAEAEASRLHNLLMQARDAFSGTLYSIGEAMNYALVDHPRKTLILADTQDNPGGGAGGDTTDLLRALHDRNAQDACAGVVCDPDFAAAACHAGAGRTISMALGGRCGVGAPGLRGDYTVMATGNGRFKGTGPFYKGCNMDLGPMARVRLGGLDIIVSSHKQQAADQAMFRHVGAEPGQYRILVLKSSVHFRADFAPLADDILVVEAPGVNTADLHKLRYRNLAAGKIIL